MFTRPSFKGLALATVLALGLGGVTALTAAATGTPVNLITSATSLTTPGTTATQLVGPANFVTLSNTVVSGPSAKAVYFTISGGTTTTATTSGTIAAGGSVSILCSQVGTITVMGYAITNGAASPTATDTIVITVVSSLPGTVYASSIVLAAPSTLLPTPATDPGFSVTAPSGTANVANFTVAEIDSAGNAILAANAKPITIIVTNGLISSPNLAASATPNTTFISGTPISSITDFVLSGIAGLGGVSTVSISVNGVLVKTYSVTFTGLATKIVLTPINSVVGLGVATSILPNAFVPTGITANVNALEVQEFDAAGNLLVVNPANISIASSAPAIAVAGGFDSANNYPLGNIVGGTPTSTKAVGVSINGVGVGTTTFTATDTTLSLTSAPASIRVSDGIPTSVVLTANLPQYGTGALGTLNTTLSNAAGTMPAGTYVVLAGQAVSSIFLSSGTAQLPGVPVAVVGPPAKKVGQVTVNNAGVYTSTFNAPITNSTVTISATPASASITVTPVTFNVGTGAPLGPEVATPESLAEAYNATTAAGEVASMTGASADTAVNTTNAVVVLVGPVQTALSDFLVVLSGVLSKAKTLAKLDIALRLKLLK
jgi:hypothetical protein